MAQTSTGYGGTDGNTASVQTTRANSPVKVRFRGFRPRSLVQISIQSDPIFLGEFEADDAGDVVVDVIIPAAVPAGDHHFVADGIDVNGQPMQSRIPTRVESPADLAFTGSNTGNVLALAGLLIVVGAAGMAAARRRLNPSLVSVDDFRGPPSRFVP